MNTRIDIAYCIALLAFTVSLSIGFVLFYFTTAIVLAVITLFATWHYAYKWLNYVWPPKSKEEN